jgi:hypothetical protein
MNHYTCETPKYKDNIIAITVFFEIILLFIYINIIANRMDRLRNVMLSHCYFK